MMRLLTAPDNLDENDKCFKIFLAGGIQKCADWQESVARWLMAVSEWDGADIVLINPRQSHFDFSDPRAVERQISWEFKYLNQMDMFTMFFYGPTDSDQPICFYELGRYIEVMKRRFPADWQTRIVVSVCREFKHHEDVVYQTLLATESRVVLGCYETYEWAFNWHKENILNAISLYFPECRHA